MINYLTVNDMTLDAKLIETLERAMRHRYTCQSEPCNFWRCDPLRWILRAGCTLAVRIEREHMQSCNVCRNHVLSSGVECNEAGMLFDQMNRFAAASNLFS